MIRNLYETILSRLIQIAFYDKEYKKVERPYTPHSINCRKH